MTAASAQPLLLQSATVQQRALRAGAVSAVQLCQMHLAAIERGNEQLNCYLSVDAEGALQAAAASDSRYRAGNPLGPLDGLCLGVKDNIAVAGMSLTAGMQCRRGEVAAEDAPVVAKLRAAGMVILGKLNMDEAALGTGGRNPHFGHCLNPWRRGHTPGGSSSGSGSACAAGLASITLGTDTMGSVRLPAALCGLYGLKPSNKTLSLEGVVPVSQDLDTIGILARSADDIALLWLALVDVPANTLPKRYRDLSWVEAAAQTALEPDVAPTAHDHTWTCASALRWANRGRQKRHICNLGSGGNTRKCGRLSPALRNRLRRSSTGIWPPSSFAPRTPPAPGAWAWC